jgi:hypothetical protein
MLPSHFEASRTGPQRLSVGTVIAILLFEVIQKGVLFMKWGKSSPLLLTTFALLFSTVSVARGPSCHQVFKISQGAPFESLVYEKTALDNNIPDTAWKGSLIDRRDRFIQEHKGRVALVKDVFFKHEAEGEIPLKGTRDVLVISLKDANPQTLLQDYFDFISLGTISFPLSRRGGHLYTRFGFRTYDNISSVGEKIYSMPKNHRIESVMQLSPSEFSNMAQYIKNVQENHDGVIGKFAMAGSQKSKGKIDDNLCLVGSHNCTSWIATAGVGKNNRPVLEILGTNMDHEVGTNPGWLSLFLNTKAKKDRVPFTVFWTTSSLKDALNEEVVSYKEIRTTFEDAISVGDGYEKIIRNDNWDFYPH